MHERPAELMSLTLAVKRFSPKSKKMPIRASSIQSAPPDYKHKLFSLSYFLPSKLIPRPAPARVKSQEAAEQ